MTTTPDRDRLLDASVPAALRVAAYAIGAPDAALAWDMGDLLEWAEQGLRVDILCGGADQHHTVHVDAHTFEMYTDAADPDIEAAHFLWALTQPGPPACTLAGEVLDNWAGPRPPEWIGNHEDRETLNALRTVVRAVQYLDEGLSVRTYMDWVETGILPDTVLEMRRLARRHGKNIDDYKTFLLGSIHVNAAPQTTPGVFAATRADSLGESMVQRLTERLADHARHKDAVAKHRQDARARAKKKRQTPTRTGRFSPPRPPLPDWAQPS